MPRARIVGTGHHVPDNVVTNFDLAEQMDTSDEWIQQRTGIVERRHVDSETGPSNLALPASEEALEMAGLEASDIDLIIFATLSPDYQFPGSGVLLQRLLGISDSTIPALDVRNQCSGYLYALSVADAYIRAGIHENILVAGAEVHSTALDFSDRGRHVTVLFGDGAGATVLQATDEDRGILAHRLHSQGEFAETLMVECPSCRSYPHRLTPEIAKTERIYPHMEGRLVFKHASTRMPEVIEQICEETGIDLESIDHFLFHQANMRINQMVANRLGIPHSKLYHNIQKYGNLSAGAIPALLDEVVRDGAIEDGDLLMMTGFGSGFTWGSIIIKW